MIADHSWQRRAPVRTGLQRPAAPPERLIEESPAPICPNWRREDICKAAVRMIKAADYTNAGTVEFIVDQDDKFLFHRGQRADPGGAPGQRDDHRG